MEFPWSFPNLVQQVAQTIEFAAPIHLQHEIRLSWFLEV